MEVALRAIAIFIEWLILSAIAYHLLAGFKLTLADLGLSPKYMKMVTVSLVAVGSLLVVFFAAHLTTFYPG